jgi:RibD C-terminal domain
MRNVVLQEFVSLDGLAAGLNNSVDFIPGATAGDPSFGQRQMSFIDTIDAILLGRVTYEMFAGFWPNVTSGDDKPFADKLNSIPKVVFSRTLDSAPWGKFEPAQRIGVPKPLFPPAPPLRPSPPRGDRGLRAPEALQLGAKAPGAGNQGFPRGEIRGTLYVRVGTDRRGSVSTRPGVYCACLTDPARGRGYTFRPGLSLELAATHRSTRRLR